jgi:lambda family phage portal protein
MIIDRLMAMVGLSRGSAGAAPAASQSPSSSAGRRIEARWGRDTPSGVLAARRRSLIDSRDDIRAAWDRIADIAIDLIQNSGRLKGAVDQVIADTVGGGLVLSARPDLARLGYTADEAAKLIRLIETRWRRYAENPDEVDWRRKFDLHTLVDIGLRHHIAYGEAVGTIVYVPPADREGATSGTRLLLTSPHRLVRDTQEMAGLHSGVLHDVKGRPVAYRFSMRENGINVKRDMAARDVDGRTLVVHVFEPWSADDVRGVSVIASALRTQAMAENLGDATLATAVLQTVFAATLTSPEPSATAFEAIERLDEDAGDDDTSLKSEFLAYFGARMDRAKSSDIDISASPQVSHLAPGEKLELQTAATPGSNYMPFSADLRRELARCIGVTYASLSMDHSDATYSSTRMEQSAIWPVVVRRRRRIAAPIYQAVYESWLDEEFGEGRIPLKGGYRAFKANRDALTWATWQGPPKPSADDYKSAKASTERLQNGTTTLTAECAENGIDLRDAIDQRADELEMLTSRGLPNPFVRTQGGSGADPLMDQPAKKSSGGGAA